MADGGTTKKHRLAPSWWDDPDDHLSVNWHIKGVIPKGALVVIYGDYGCGKTFWTFDLVGHIALGWDWRGRKTRPAGVLYVAAEGGSGIWQRRRAFKQRIAPTIGDVPFGVIAASIDLRNPRADTDELIRQIKSAECSMPVETIVIDTVGRALAGGDDTDDMPALIANCDRIRAATGCTIILIHHTGKDKTRGPRGAYKLPCDGDTVIKVEESADGSRIATVEKQRDGEDGQTFAFRLEKVEIGKDDDGDPITSCVVVPTDDKPAAATPDQELTPNQRTMFRILHEAGPAGLTLDDWNERARKAGLGVNRPATLYDLRAALKEKGLVRECSTDRWVVAR